MCIRDRKLHPVKDPRFKITHCSLVNDDIVRRMKALNVTPALFNTYLYFNSASMVMPCLLYTSRCV